MKALEELKELVSDNWFVDNPNGSDVNEEIGRLILALEKAIEQRDEWVRGSDVGRTVELLNEEIEAILEGREHE